MGNDSASGDSSIRSAELIEIDRRLSELEAMKPSLMRLISIETDIKALINELNTLADDYSGSPDGVSADTGAHDDEIEYLSVSDLMGGKDTESDDTQSEGEGDTPPRTATPPSPSTAQTPITSAETVMPSIPAVQQPTPRIDGTASDFAIHLTSYRDARNLMTGWDKLKMQHSDILMTLTPKVEWVSSATGESFLRLKAGPFTSRAAARQACQLIRARNAYCAISSYEGANIQDFVVQ